MGEPNWPFIGTEALAAGQVSRRTLRSQHEMIYRNVYLRKDQQLSAATRAMAAWLWSGRHATVAGLSAAAWHGSRWVDPWRPAELNRSEACATAGIVIHREALLADESCVVRGVAATTPARTAFDLGRRAGLTAAVIHVDALANVTGLTPAEVRAVAERHCGARGLVQLRRVVELMDGGAESPQESRTRLLLIRSGLRQPETQIVVYDEFGYPFARIDMGWTEWKVGVEFDGAQHWTDPAQRTADIDRYAELAVRGWVIIRVSANLLRYRPAVVIARICAALQAAGCPWVPECGLNARLSA